MKDLVKTSKYLSLILRHNPDIIGINLDENGWANVDELIKGMDISFDILENVVENNNKKRFTFNPDLTKIRANQGHSINVDLGLKPIVPPSNLYHGTIEESFNLIRLFGLKKMKRNHVHLSRDEATAYRVGKRRGYPIILHIDAWKMFKDDFQFFQSKNGVWLTDNVPFKYITSVVRDFILEKLC